MPSGAQPVIPCIGGKYAVERLIFKTEVMVDLGNTVPAKIKERAVMYEKDVSQGTRRTGNMDNISERCSGLGMELL